MSYNKLSNFRLLRFVAMLKDNRYPNHPRLMEEMRKYNSEGKFEINQKTIKRDLDCLKTEYHAPIEYNVHHRGYYLTNPNWEFDVSAMRENEQESALISARLAESMFPRPVGERIKQSVDALLAASDTKMTSERTALLSLIATGSRAPIKPEIFEDVFQGWRSRKVLLLHYTSASTQKDSEMLVEPHILAFYDGNWYLKVKLLQKDGIEYPEGKNVLTLAAHRISNVAQTGNAFHLDQTLIKNSNKGVIFDLPTVKNIRLKLRGKSAIYGQENFKINSRRQLKDGSLILHIPMAEEYRILNFVMASLGEAQILSPQSLRKKVSEAALVIAEKHS